MNKRNEVDKIIINNFERIIKISESVVNEKLENNKFIGEQRIDILSIKDADDLLSNSA